MLDANGGETVVGLSNTQYFKLRNTVLKNFTKSGVKTDFYDNGSGAGATAIENTEIIGLTDAELDVGIDFDAKTNDCWIDTVTIKDCKTAMRFLGGNIKVNNVHAWCSTLEKYLGSVYASIKNGRVTFVNPVVDTYQYGFLSDVQMFVTVQNLIFMSNPGYSADHEGTIIQNELSYDNNSFVSIDGLMVCANSGKVKVLSNNIYKNYYSRLDLLQFSGVQQTAYNTEMSNVPLNSNQYNFNFGYATVNKSTNYDNLNSAVAEVNTYIGTTEEGNNAPPSNVSGILFNCNNNAFNLGYQLILLASGGICYRIKRENIWSSWITIKNTN